MGTPTEQLIEHDIAALEQQLRAKREELSRQHEAGEIPAAPDDRTVLHEVVKERIGEYQPSTSAPAVSATDEDQSAPLADQVAPTPVPASEGIDPELQPKVQELVNAAFQKGIDVAINEARATGNAALIDTFHDVLVDELYTYLVDQGKLQHF